MWKELLEDYDIHLPGDLDLKQSVFVGDAGGRIASDGKPKDFSCSDRYSSTTISKFASCLHVAEILQTTSVSSFTRPKSSFSRKSQGRSGVHLSHRDILLMRLEVSDSDISLVTVGRMTAHD